MRGNRIVIVDYGMGNLNSINRKLNRLNANSTISCDANDIKNADKIILPGVGHFGKAMEALTRLNLTDSLHEAVLAKKKPILGICLGMQLLAKKSEEGNVNGLGWIDSEVVKFAVNNTLKYKIPHTAWNQAIIMKDSPLMHHIPDLSEFYFSHSFYFIAHNKEDVLTETVYEHRFVSAVGKENIYGVQFHPEKSYEAGEGLLKNFIKL